MVLWFVLSAQCGQPPSSVVWMCRGMSVRWMMRTVHPPRRSIFVLALSSRRLRIAGIGWGDGTCMSRGVGGWLRAARKVCAASERPVLVVPRCARGEACCAVPAACQRTSLAHGVLTRAICIVRSHPVVVGAAKPCVAVVAWTVLCRAARVCGRGARAALLGQRATLASP
jgi:hypothetical protein